MTVENNGNDYYRALYDLRVVAEGIALSLTRGGNYAEDAQRLESEHPVPAPLVTAIGSDVAVLVMRQLAHLQRLERDGGITAMPIRRMPSYGPARSRPHTAQQATPNGQT